MSQGYSTHRMLNDRRGLDQSNHTLRFNRSLREASWHGGIDQDEGPGLIVGILVGCAIGAVIWGFVIVALGWA